METVYAPRGQGFTQPEGKVGINRAHMSALYIITALAYYSATMSANGKGATMGRPSDYTPEEDTIILETAGDSIAHTNRMLVGAGFRERTKSAITGRRTTLKRQRDGDASQLDTQQLLRRRDQLRRAFEETQRALLDVEMTLGERLTEELQELHDHRRLMEELGVGEAS